MLPMEKIRMLGRYALAEGELWMASSLCEAGFRLKGASGLLLRLKADDTVTDPERTHLTPRYAVRVNGKLFRDAHLTQKEETVSVPADVLGGDAEVRLIKLTESTQSIFALTDIRTDGEMTPLPLRKERISFIGDSITCGYGVEAKSGLETFSTRTENAEKSYAALAADALGMDRELVCFSGHGIVSGWTGDPDQRNVTELAPLYYEKIGRNSQVLPGGRRLEDMDWDFSLFQPDWIVVNLGTNDLSWCKDFQDRKAMFRKEYASFLRTVRRRNPEAKILCVLGLMGGGLNEEMVQAVKDASANGDAGIQTLTVPPQDGEKDGFGADFHPSEITQRRLAEWVVQAIRPT